MLIDSDEVEKESKNNKLKKALIIFIVVFSIICMAVAGAIYYTMQNPNEEFAYIDGKKINGLLQIIDMQTDEQGNVKMYFPIRKFASYLNSANPEYKYVDYGGDYETKSEDINKCYIVREKYEVTMYSNNSKKIYKKNLENNNSEYEAFSIDEDIFLNKDDILYASTDGIEKGYNVFISYDKNKKSVSIYTLDYLIDKQSEKMAKKTFENYTGVQIDTKNYNNLKAIFEDKLIVTDEKNKYGLWDIERDKFILEPKYDNVTYITETKSFLVKSNGKFGMLDSNGEKKLELAYDEIVSMGQESGLYVVKSNQLYGIVNENGKNILYTQYDQIGIDVKSFANNDAKNGYLILDTLIPVKQGNLWALFDKNGKMVSEDFKYKEIGCSKAKSSTNVYPVLQIPEKSLIVVKADSKYGFMNLSGNDDIVPFIIDEVYIKVKDGKSSYYISYNNGKELDIIEYFDKKQ